MPSVESIGRGTTTTHTQLRRSGCQKCMDENKGKNSLSVLGCSQQRHSYSRHSCIDWLKPMSDVLWFFGAAIAAALPIPFINPDTLTNYFIWIILSIISYFFLVFA